MNDMIQDDTPIYFGTAVKASGNGLVEGYLVPFTSPAQKDLHGEYFDRDTDLHLSDHPVEGKPVMYQHGFDPELGVSTIGSVKASRHENAGLWIQAQLDMANEYAKRVYKLAKEGKLAWSSGALPQSVRKSADGKITNWAIIEATITPTPAMPYLTQITSKSAVQEGAVIETVSATDSIIESNTLVTENPQMELEALKAEISRLAGLIEGVDSAVKAEAVEAAANQASELRADVLTEDRIEQIVVKTITDIQAKAEAQKARLNQQYQKAAPATSKASQINPAAPGASSAPQARQSRIEVGDNLKYASMDAATMAFGYQMFPERPSEEYMRHMVGKMHDFVDNASGLKHETKLTMKALNPYAKADELNASNIAGQGDEWVNNWYSEFLWEAARDTPIMGSLRTAGLQMQMVTGETATFYKDGDDPDVYYVTQANDADAVNNPESVVGLSPYATGSVVITPKRLAVRTGVEDTLTEDSGPNAINHASVVVQRALLETFDKLFMNGDVTTTANNNINLNDGTPATGIAKPYYLAMDGVRKLCLVTNTAQSLDASGAVTKTLLHNTIKLLPDKIRRKREQNVIIFSGDSYFAAMLDPSIEKYMETLRSGMFNTFYGMSVVDGGDFLPLAETDGTIAGSGSNVTGSIAVVHAPYWLFAYRRQIRLQRQRWAASFTDEIVADMRVGLDSFDNSSAALAYNVGV